MWQETSAVRDVGLGAALIIALRLVEKLVERLLRKNGTAGEQSPDYWNRIFDELRRNQLIMIERLDKVYDLSIEKSCHWRDEK